MEDLIEYLGSYLIGSLPMGFMTAKFFKGRNGWILVQGLNVLKGAAAVFLARKLSPSDPPDMIAAGFLALMGDRFPVFSGFKGTQSLGTLIGVFGALLLALMGKI